MPLPLTQAQLGLWHEEQASPGGTLHHIAEVLTIRGPLNTALFEEALRRALADVTALHVRFSEQGGRAWQTPTGEAPRPLRHVDLRGRTDPPSEARVQTLTLLDRPLGLRTGDLYRHTLYRLDEQAWQWALITHHIALDGYGMTQVLNGVAAHYRALSGLHAVPAPFGPLGPVIEEDEAYQRSPERAAHGTQLRALYADLPFEEAPLLTLGLRRGHRVQATLPPPLVRALRTESVQGAAWPDVLFAASAACWHAHTGERTVLLAAPVMLRLGSAAARVPCMRMNLLPLRVDVRPADTLRTLTRRAHEARQATQRAAAYRFEHLWADLRGRRLFGPEVNVIPYAAPLDFGPDVQVTRDTPASGPVEDLAFTFAAWGESLSVTLDGHPDLYTAAQLRMILHRFTALLAAGLPGTATVPA
ncbi:condensation domain-containing protein (plasmid) [Deinococcus taeanensis]|uniref:condensation domain-containing protein n=1 Tax=Deinococcus taeanensis TaxID=2737050 RepID=UPI001CDB889B|nr:condensation domain-containing protein [Deinococcus taeanensis]UBV45045.1 condensation domain-containing protein [Deinococcus taeanensis]